MIDRYIKNYNDLFLKEINSMKTIQDSLGEFTNKDLNKLHMMMAEGMLSIMYRYFPTILIFNPYFFIFSNKKQTVDNYKKSKIRVGRWRDFSKTISEDEKKKYMEIGKRKRRLTHRLYLKHRH